MGIFALTQSCNLLFKSEFSKLEAGELSTLAESLSDSQKRMLAQNDAQRKQLIQTFKQAFALAQAAEAEGVDKSDKFKNRFNLNVEQLLATEYTKRNPDVTISQQELKAYYDTNKAEFDKDFNFISGESKEQVSEEQKEQLRMQWAELRIRAQRARQAGIDKEAVSKIQLKISKANLLANLYSESLEQKMKPSDQDIKKYIAEHPEADMEKIQKNAEAVLARIKNGEPFEKVADEVNEDGTRGRGGDLDWFSRGKMDPDFENVAFALEKGQVSKDLVKSQFGFHIIRVDDKRKVAPTPTPAQPATEPGKTAAEPAKKPEPVEEVKARHIYISTTEAKNFERKMTEDKVKRAMEDASLKYKVAVPDDFTIRVPGYDPSRSGAPKLNKQIDPNANR